MNTHSHATPKVFMFRCEWVFTLDKNQRSRCIRIGVHDGCEYAAGTDTQIRIQENTGAGRFSDEWLSLKAIGKTPFTSAKLKELIKGKSINTPAFILAVT